MEYRGIQKAADIMNDETIKHFAVSAQKEYYVFTERCHTVGIPVRTCLGNKTLEQARIDAQNSIPN